VLPPGLALHTELELLVQAGLTPLEAITAASYTPAQLLGIERQSGSLRQGCFADLLLLDADPLADITHSLAIEQVFLAGAPAYTRST
jgi:imidazolonepropionase-like amidohydrolase